MKFINAFLILGLCAAAYADNECEPKACPLIFMPVCATNNLGESRTFDNVCILRNTQCSDKEAEWHLIATEACSAETDCPQACTQEYKPVCAKNNLGKWQTFGNPCVLRSTQCRDKAAEWRLISTNACKQPKESADTECPEACTQEYRPVCAKNNLGKLETFGNPCLLRSTQCRDKAAEWRLITPKACKQPKE